MEKQDRPNDQPISDAALWAAILGVVSLCLGPLGLVAIALGIVGIFQTDKPDGPRGNGLAVGGIALGLVGAVGTFFTVGALLPAVRNATQTAKELASFTNMTELRSGVQRYYENSGESLSEDAWKPAIASFLGVALDDPMFTSPLSDGDTIEYVFVPGDFGFDDRLIMFYEDPDQTFVHGKVHVVYDGGRGGRLDEADLRAELRSRGMSLRR